MTGTISFADISAAAEAVNNTNKKVIHKNCARSTDCIIGINNAQVDDANDIDIVMPMCNLLDNA